MSDSVERLKVAILGSVMLGEDLGDVLSSALVSAAEVLGSVEALVAGRPGSWEAADIRHLAGGADVPDSMLNA